jgi:hypothetical protein
MYSDSLLFFAVEKVVWPSDKIEICKFLAQEDDLSKMTKKIKFTRYF